MAHSRRLSALAGRGRKGSGDAAKRQKKQLERNAPRMVRRLRLADGAGSQSLKQKRAGTPLALDAPRPQSQACRLGGGCSTGGTAEKSVFPQRSSLSKIQAIAAARGIRIRSASLLRPDQTDARAAPASPLWARRLRPRRSKRQTQRQPPFGAPAFRAHPAARQAKRRPFGAVWSPAPVCHPIRMTSPAIKPGGEMRHVNLEARGGAYCCFHPTIGTTA